MVSGAGLVIHAPRVQFPPDPPSVVTIRIVHMCQEQEIIGPELQRTCIFNPQSATTPATGETHPCAFLDEQLFAQLYLLKPQRKKGSPPFVEDVPNLERATPAIVRRFIDLATSHEYRGRCGSSHRVSITDPQQFLLLAKVTLETNALCGLEGRDRAPAARLCFLPGCCRFFYEPTLRYARTPHLFANRRMRHQRTAVQLNADPNVAPGRHFHARA